MQPQDDLRGWHTLNSKEIQRRHNVRTGGAWWNFWEYMCPRWEVEGSRGKPFPWWIRWQHPEARGLRGVRLGWPTPGLPARDVPQTFHWSDYNSCQKAGDLHVGDKRRHKIAWLRLRFPYFSELGLIMVGKEIVFWGQKKHKKHFGKIGK